MAKARRDKQAVHEMSAAEYRTWTVAQMSERGLSKAKYTGTIVKLKASKDFALGDGGTPRGLAPTDRRSAMHNDSITNTHSNGIFVVCAECGAGLTRPYSRVKRSVRQFCDNYCHANYRKNHPSISTDDRFDEKVDRRENGCWEWIGYIEKTTGYGRFYDDNRVVNGAHRYAYRRAKGEIPEGMVIDHLCRNRKCVNPNHLEAVSVGENIRRGASPSIHLSRVQVCARGHAYAEHSYYCRACERENQRERRKRGRT